MTARESDAAARRQAENAPAVNGRTPPRIDNATDTHTLTHAIGRGAQTTANIGHRSAEPGSNRIEADENAADRGKLDTSQQFAENPLTAGRERMERQRGEGHGDRA